MFPDIIDLYNVFCEIHLLESYICESLLKICVIFSRLSNVIKTIYIHAEYAIINASAYKADSKSVVTYFKKNATLEMIERIFARMMDKVNAKYAIFFIRLSLFSIGYTLCHTSHFRFKESRFISKHR